jgi:AraC-like DNA-binding protein
LIRTGIPVINQLEMHVYHSGRVGWCLTNKLPLRGHQGQVVGLVGISKDLQAPNERGSDYSPLATVVQHIQAHYADKLHVGNLASFAGLSPYQLDQRIRRIFQISTGQFILKVRMDAAVRRLKETEDGIATIALDCGYSDQSAFTRQFRQTVGLTPSEFRKTTAA